MARERVRMKPARKSRRSKQEIYDEAAEPLHGNFCRRPDGKEIFVPLRAGYPGPGEPINEEMAAFALRHRRADIVAGYLRETKYGRSRSSKWIERDLAAARTVLDDVDDQGHRLDGRCISSSSRRPLRRVL